MPTLGQDISITEQKREIPAFDSDTGKREIVTDGMSILQIMEASMVEYRTSIMAKLNDLATAIAAISERVKKLEDAKAETRD